MTKGFLGFLIQRSPAGGACPGPKGQKSKLCSSENETVSVGGWSGNGRGWRVGREGVMSHTEVWVAGQVTQVRHLPWLENSTPNTYGP